MEILEYLTQDGQSPFDVWLCGLRDRSARARIRVRLDRVRLDNLGDYRSVGDGVYELRIPFGIATMAKSKPYQESLLESLAEAGEAAAYLNAALDDGDREVFLLALRNVADARLGGMSKLAEATGLNRESLYRMLSEQGNPELNSLSRLLHALGLKLAVEADENAA